MNERIVSHGIPFIRTGTCVQCGACGCGDCPHHIVRDGKHWCDVYDERDRVCEICTEIEGEEIDHAGCIGYPDNPWIRVVRQGVCAYTFKREDGGSMDDIPFLNGKPYLK